MSYIREKTTELTGYQEHSPYNPNIDLQCDFVMVYGTDDTMPERVRKFLEKGYVVHLMTGSAWGEYQDYLYGKWDGLNHWDESQCDRHGNNITHGEDVPYMVPTIAFTDYITERLKISVDAGVEAIHLEEPEFWDYGGYSPAFQREYLLYYHEKWQPPHTNLDVRYKSSKLKAYLYARALSRISASLKEYAMVKYGRVLQFYVPTHSLLNYTQWKIMSPEGALIDIPSVDGYIAQVWTGTSRSANVYGGVVKERTFETAYLEYGIMQELVKGTGRRMWFLHDPIEDNPEYAWEDYKYNYLKTVTASLLHPHIHNYEICPWPDRVFNGVYPRSQNTGKPMENAKSIPPDYASLLCGIIQTLGDMDQNEFAFSGTTASVGILMSDSGLFQRTYPDGIIPKDDIIRCNEMEKALTDITERFKNGEDCITKSRELFKNIDSDESLLKAFTESGTFPNFFGMALPLLKYGLPVHPAQLDNIRRFPGYVDDYTHLILSYEYIKPEAPDINNALAAWVRLGGTLIYLGDGSDPYHKVEGWWNRQGVKYENPAQHLFEMLGLTRNPESGVYHIGEGNLALWNIAPAKLCISPNQAEEYRTFIRGILEQSGEKWVYSNQLTLRRGPYIVSAVLDESVSLETHEFKGLFADMFTNNFLIVESKILHPDESTLLFDFSKIKDESCRVIGCSARVLSLECKGKEFSLSSKGADSISARIRIRLPHKVNKVSAINENGSEVSVEYEWDDRSQTLLLSYDSHALEVAIKGSFAQ